MCSTRLRPSSERSLRPRLVLQSLTSPTCALLRSAEIKPSSHSLQPRLVVVTSLFASSGELEVLDPALFLPCQRVRPHHHKRGTYEKCRTQTRLVNRRARLPTVSLHPNFTPKPADHTSTRQPFLSLELTKDGPTGCFRSFHRVESVL